MTSGSLAKNYSLVSVILILGVIVAGYMVMTSYWPEYTFAKDRKINVQADNARLKKALDASQDFLRSYESQNQNSDLINLAIPKKDSDMANFVGSFSQLASQSGVVLTGLQISSKDPLTTTLYSIQPVELSMSVTGTYLSFKDFLRRVEEHLRIIDVHHVVLSSEGSSGTGTVPMEFQLLMRTYYQQ